MDRTYFHIQSINYILAKLVMSLVHENKQRQQIKQVKKGHRIYTGALRSTLI